MTISNRTSSVVRWALRLAGLAVVFVFTAAPLPGDTPGCDTSSGLDDSATIAGGGLSLDASNAAVRAICGARCARDCARLVACGRYASGSGETICMNECTITGRDCLNQTFDTLCPVAAYPDRLITEDERTACLDDSQFRDCWCDDGVNCWDASMPLPASCTAGGLCDPR
jgi:hypothetical protein